MSVGGRYRAAVNGRDKGSAEIEIISLATAMPKSPLISVIEQLLKPDGYFFVKITRLRREV
jgi:hypothetical protein